MAVAFWVVCRFNSNVNTGCWLLVWISNVVESIIAKIDVVVTCTALILATLASVAGVVLRASIRYFHYNTGAITSAVAAAVVLATNLESATAHGGRTGRALTLANVLVPAVIAITLGAGWI